MPKPILCLDFDGVCHSYTSGWINAWTIPDPPVAGLFPFLEQALVTFRVAIYSSRSEFEKGRAAMADWFMACAIEYYAYTHTSDLEDGSPRDNAKALLERLEFPVSKPSAFVTLDDRAVTFKGNWPSIEDLHGFKPWNDHLKKPRVSDVAASTYGRE